MSAPKLRGEQFLQWSRLEPRPRTEQSLARGLRAELRDPLWSLARQLQFGELRAADGGSPVTATVETESFTLSRVASAARSGLDPCIAIEACQEPVDLRVRLDVAGAALAVLEEAALPVDLRAALREQFPLQGVTGVVGRRGFDGVALLRALVGGAPVAALSPLEPVDRARADAALSQLQSAYAPLLARLAASDLPTPPGCWVGERLEHAGEVLASGADGAEPARLSFSELIDGHVDHASFAFEASGAGVRRSIEVLVAPASAPWLPRPRMFEIEGHPLDLARMDLVSPDPARVLFTEFVLQFDGEWAIMPLTAAAGSVLGVTSLTLTSTFGRRHRLAPAASQSDGGATRLFTAGTSGGASYLVVGPTSPFQLDGPSLEEVYVARDEWSNLVWAIESVVPALAFAGQARAAVPPPDEPEVTAPTLHIRRDPPAGWFPYQPRSTGPGEVRFERVSGGDPKTSVVRQLASLREEEVPREGVVVKTAFHRARTQRGEVMTWLARRVGPGAGETSSGMAFDRLTEPRAAPVQGES